MAPATSSFVSADGRLMIARRSNYVARVQRPSLRAGGGGGGGEDGALSKLKALINVRKLAIKRETALLGERVEISSRKFQFNILSVCVREFQRKDQ